MNEYLVYCLFVYLFIYWHSVHRQSPTYGCSRTLTITTTHTHWMEINMSDNTEQNPNKLTRWQEPKRKPTGNSLRI